MNETAETKELPVIDRMSIEELKTELADNEIPVHHKTGLDKLQNMVQKVRAGNYVSSQSESKTTVKSSMPVAPTAAAKAAKELHEAAKTNPKLLSKEQRALRLRRIIVTCNDPNFNDYPGLIFNAASSAVNKGRMIKKYVPFDNQEGWHVPQILCDQIEQAQVQKFKPVTMPDGQKTMQPYLAKKFNVQYLPDLTDAELKSLAAAQQSRGGV